MSGHIRIANRIGVGVSLLILTSMGLCGQEIGQIVVADPIQFVAQNPAPQGEALAGASVQSPSDANLEFVDDFDDELDALLEQDLTSLRKTAVAPSLDVEVTTVSRQQSTVGRTPAAIFVISQEMIRRSGVRSIPEALRLAPGLHVARIDGNKWSITSRGFSGRFSNKLLVQIDGRTVYTPLFAGVFWDVQDLLLEDVLRIEVVRGPGATVWGANAVNGVINILTKPASETRGVYAMGGGGTEEEGFAGARIGGRTEKGVDWRVSGKWFERNHLFEPLGRENDQWNQGRINYRADWKPTCCDAVTLDAAYYDGTNHNAAIRPFVGETFFEEPVSGGHVLGRWTRKYGRNSDSTLQFFYDRTDRNTLGFDQRINTIDFDFQRRFHLNQRHRLIWGLGYRRIWDNLTNDSVPAFISMVPNEFTVEWVSGFIQDEIVLSPDWLYLTIGTKLSHNTFTHTEVQPNVRLLWLPTERSAAWASVSRAVRTPSRATETAQIMLDVLPFPPNTPLMLFGGNNDSEALIAYEFGYRQQTTEYFFWDFAAFFNHYDDLQTIQLVAPPLAIPFTQFFNGATADSVGCEISANLQLSKNWSIQAWYSFLRIDAEVDPRSVQVATEFEKSDPRNQAFLMSSWNLGRCREVDLIARYVDNLPNLGVPSYLSLDARYSVRFGRGWEATVVGQNLLDSHHPEYGSNRYTGDIATEVPRGVYGMLQWRH